MKILLVRLRLIGDVVFTTPIIRALRRRYPDAHLTYLVEPAAAPVVRGNPESERGDRRYPEARDAALRDDSRFAGRLRRAALRRRDRPARRSARVPGSLGQRRRRCASATDAPDAPGCTPTSSRARPTFRRNIRC